MKSIIIILIAVLIITSNVGFAQETRASGERLALNIMREEYAKGENSLISPYSLYTALSMAAQGAKGDTLNQMLTALDTDAPDNIAIEGATTANAAFIAGDAGVTDEYLSKLSAYDARVFDLGENGLNDINLWAKQATNGIIDPLLSRPLDETTKLALLNAITMKAQWRTPFKSSSTDDRTFHASQGDVEVPFMMGMMDMPYSERDGLQMGVLAYDQNSLNAYFILPPQGGMEKALETLSSEGYGMFEGIENGSVKVFLPKLDISSDMELSKALINNGVTDAFSYAADFSGINGDTDLMIDKVIQKASLKVDEDGTQAAAATSVSMIPKGIMPSAENAALFKLDRPFIMLVRDETSGQTLFCACIENPVS